MQFDASELSGVSVTLRVGQQPPGAAVGALMVSAVDGQHTVTLVEGDGVSAARTLPLLPQSNTAADKLAPGPPFARHLCITQQPAATRPSVAKPPGKVLFGRAPFVAKPPKTEGATYTPFGASALDGAGASAGAGAAADSAATPPSSSSNKAKHSKKRKEEADVGGDGSGSAAKRVRTDKKKKKKKKKSKE